MRSVNTALGALALLALLGPAAAASKPQPVYNPDAGDAYVPPLVSPDLSPAANGAVLTRASEDITLSSQAIRIQESWMAADPSKPQHATFVLKLPDLESRAPGCDAVGLCAPVGKSDDPNYFGVTGTVDGKPIAFRIVTRAFVNKRDITAELQKAQIPLMPESKASQTALAQLKPDLVAAWTKAGWIDNEGKDAVYGLWSVASELSFDADIAPGKSLQTEIVYAPSVGHGRGAAFLGYDEGANHTMVDHQQRYCMDKGFIASARKMSDATKPALWMGLWERQLEFDLLSAVAAKNQAGDLRLIVDKSADKDAIVSFCGHIVKTLGPGRWQVQPFDGEQGTPTKNFEVLFISKR